MKYSVHVAAPDKLAVEAQLDNTSSLASNIQRMVTLLQVPNEEYGLYLESSRRWVTEEDVRAADYSTWLPNHAVLRLRVAPEAQVRNNIRALTSSDEVSRRKALAELKKTLTDDSFHELFLQNGGVAALAAAAQSLQGNALASCLSALARLVSMDATLAAQVPSGALHYIVVTADAPSSGSNIRSPAMVIAAALALSSTHGFTPVHTAVVEAAARERRRPYEGILDVFGSSVVNMKMDALKLINALLEGGGSAMLTNLRELGITRKLQQQLRLDDEGVRRQLVLFQHAMFRDLDRRRRTLYDARSVKHQQILQRLWEKLFPSTPLKTLASDQWQELGFQSNDPGQEARSVGILGLENLLYFAQNQPDKLRNIVTAQKRKADEGYPVAVVGISITELLLDLVIGPENTIKQILYPVFFDSDTAFEELYCIVFQLLDRAWEEMDVAFIDYPSVLAAVNRTVALAMKEAETLQAFRRCCASLKRTAATEGQDVNRSICLPTESTTLNEGAIAALKNDARQRQAESTLRKGAVMKEVKKGKPQGWMWVVLDVEADSLLWGPADSASSSGPVADTPHSLSMSNVDSVVVGNELATTVFRGKKLDDEVLQRGFSLTNRTGEDGVDLMAVDEASFSLWSDALRTQLGRDPVCSSTLENLEVVVMADVAARMINLQGVTELPEAPEVPPPPDNFNFFTQA